MDILKLIDFEKVDNLLEGFNKATGFVTAILDLEGNIISKSGWRQICTDFHRINPETSNNCKISDTVLANQLDKNEKYHFYKCLNGLVDVAVPIIIKDKHVANLFSGQFFTEEPDKDFFIEQAKKYNFDQNEYLNALDNVPVVSMEKVKDSMDFLLSMTQLISDLTFQKIEQRHVNEELAKSELRFSKLYQNSPLGMVIADKNFKFVKANPSFCSIIGYTESELQQVTIKEISHSEDVNKDLQNVQKLINSEIHIYKTEKRYIRKDGVYIWGSLTVTATYDNSGNFLYYLGMIEDVTARKIAEQEIKKLSERISTATKASKVGIWDWDIENNTLYWDDQMYELYGVKKAEFSGAFEAWVNGLHPEDKEFSIQQTHLALKGEKEYDTEFRLLWPDGSVHFCRARGEVYRNSENKPIRMIGINYDITEHKNQQEKIREKDLEFKKLSANVPDLLYQFTRKPDGSYCVPIASEGIINIFGCYPEDVLDTFEPIARVLHPDDVERIISEIEYSAKNLSYFTCEFRVMIPGKDIQWIYSKSTPEKLPDGSITWYGFNTDITQRKLAEESLKESEEKYRQIFDNTFDFMSIYEVTEDMRFKVLNFNPSEEKLIGSIELYRNKYIDECIPPDLYYQFKQNYDRCIKEEKLIIYDEDISFQHINKTFNTQLIPLKNSEGRIHRIIVISRDITDFKNLNRQLTEQNEKLKSLNNDLTIAKEKAEESDTLKTAFINTISHEIRTPLNGILGFGQLMLEPDISQQERQEFYNHLHYSSNRLVNTISDFIDMAKIVSGSIEVSKNDFLINDFFNEIYLDTKRLCDEKGIDFEIVNPSDSKKNVLNSDEDLIRKVLKILLDNAIKFTNKGSIILGYNQMSSCIEFFVQDTGSGIAPDKLELIFEMFSQEDTSYSSGYEGSGLGLTIARNLVKLLEGNLSVESVKGEGSTFTFTIPIETKLHDTDFSIDDTIHSLRMNNLNILICEDDEFNFLYMREIMKILDCNFLHAKNGEEAVEFCKNNEDINLVLMDIKMPGMNGIEATQLIREFKPDLSIIAITSYAQNSDEQRCLAAGCNGYLAKPVKKENLLSMIQAMTSKN